MWCNSRFCDDVHVCHAVMRTPQGTPAQLPPFPDPVQQLVRAGWNSVRELLTAITRSQIKHLVRARASARVAWKVLKEPRCVLVGCVCLWGGIGAVGVSRVGCVVGAGWALHRLCCCCCCCCVCVCVCVCARVRVCTRTCSSCHKAADRRSSLYCSTAGMAACMSHPSSHPNPPSRLLFPTLTSAHCSSLLSPPLTALRCSPHQPTHRDSLSRKALFYASSPPWTLLPAYCRTMLRTSGPMYAAELLVACWYDAMEEAWRALAAAGARLECGKTASDECLAVGASSDSSGLAYAAALVGSARARTCACLLHPSPSPRH